MAKGKRLDSGTIEVLMFDLGTPKWATYEGSMVTASGKTVAVRLSPGIHVLPEDKALQLCESFPFLFTMDSEKIGAAKSGALPDPPTPVSSESSTSAAPASSTDSSGLDATPEISESEA